MDMKEMPGYLTSCAEEIENITASLIAAKGRIDEAIADFSVACDIADDVVTNIGNATNTGNKVYMAMAEELEKMRDEIVSLAEVSVNCEATGNRQLDIHAQLVAQIQMIQNTLLLMEEGVSE
jgi:ApbE superfamily uncharacterized protein (UPF0280 family)